ncbi:major tail protein [Solibacillus silvestris]
MAVEFRGCKNLVFAEVQKDNNLTTTGEGYVTGTVKSLAPVAEISKSVETSSEAHYYDNVAAIVIDSEGKDEVKFTIAIPDDEILAEITGRTYDATAKMFIESERKQKYFAVGYILGEKGEGDDERYVWRYKGTFNIPDETSATENDGTDANNMSLVFTGIYTDHKFANGIGIGNAGVAKAAFIRESSNVATAAQWFAAVATPDTTFTP